jgi:F-type H+-transporting ATPase subunit b
MTAFSAILQSPLVQALGGILLLKSIPTIFLLLLLYFYLKAMLFKPLNQVLKQRDDLTEGTRRGAQKSLEEAERKVREYEGKMREARAEVYREQEVTRARWIEEQAAQVTAAGERTGAGMAAAREQLAAEIATARLSLAESSGALADEIATAVLSRRNG